MAAFIDAIKDPSWIRSVGMLFLLMNGAMWFYHYWVEFQVVLQIPAPTIFIIFHLLPVALGSILYVIFLRRSNVIKIFGPSTVLMLILMGVSSIITEDIYVSVALLIGVGVSGGISTSSELQLISFATPSIESRGRLYCFGHIGIVLVLLVGLLISFFLGGLGSLLYYFGMGIIFSIMTYQVKDIVEKGLPPPTTINAWSVASESKLLPVYLASLFQGFFFTAMYYAIFTFLEQGTRITRALFILDLFVVILLVSVPVGMATDRYGRKIVILLGAYLQGIALLLAAVFVGNNDVFAYLIIIPLLGIGVLSGVFLAFLLFIESAPEFGLRSFFGISVTTFGVGMGLGLLTTEFIGQDPLTFPMFLLFLYFTFTLVIAQIKEPLPSKEDREWRSSIHELLVIGDGGLPLVQHRFQQGSIQVDSSLTSGALTGIDGLISEITKGRGAIKIIKQERFCIMLEHGDGVTLALLTDSESAILREKLQYFLAEFMAFFGNLVREWSGDVVVFSPADRIIMKVFG